MRAPVVFYNRSNEAAARLQPGDFNWNAIFEGGVRWFHSGGIFAALSATTAQVIIEAAKAAKAHGTVVSYDLNYRPSLWRSIGGLAKAREVNREIARYVDVMIGNEEDFTASLGFEVEGVDEHLSDVPVESFKKTLDAYPRAHDGFRATYYAMGGQSGTHVDAPAHFAPDGKYLDELPLDEMIEAVRREFPNFQAVATTLRAVKSATVNDWSAVLWCDGEFHSSRKYKELEIMDRVGGGDSFASGLIYGFLAGKSASEAVNYGAAHGALAMTTPGDTSMATLDEVEKLMRGGNARVVR